MSKKRSDMQRIVEFFMAAPVDDAKQALEVAKAIVGTRLTGTSPLAKRLVKAEMASIKREAAAVRAQRDGTVTQ